MVYRTLVDTGTLADHLGTGWRVFDCRFVLSDPGAGECSYRQGHIPEAHYLHLDRDLAGPVTPQTGRHPLPAPTVLAAKLASAGVNATTQVVVYDDTVGTYAARLWWLLRWLGHSKVAVLDGGWSKWIKEGRPLTPVLPTVSRSGAFRALPNNALWLSTEAVWERLKAPAPGCLLDARTAERFRGDEEPIDPVAGHIPGSVNLAYTGNVLSDGCFSPPGALRERFRVAMAGIPPAETVCLCGSGVTACHNLLAMEVAGLEGARLYPGSWSEWIRDRQRPVVRGT